MARTRHPTCWDFSMTEFPDRVPVLLSSHAVGTVSNDPQELNTKNIPNSMGTHALPQDHFSLSPFPKILLTDVPSPPFFSSPPNGRKQGLRFVRSASGKIITEGYWVLQEQYDSAKKKEYTLVTAHGLLPHCQTHLQPFSHIDPACRVFCWTGTSSEKKRGKRKKQGESSIAPGGGTK